MRGVAAKWLGTRLGFYCEEECSRKLVYTIGTRDNLLSDGCLIRELEMNKGPLILKQQYLGYRP